jgi:hypothetical protein
MNVADYIESRVETWREDRGIELRLGAPGYPFVARG